MKEIEYFKLIKKFCIYMITILCFSIYAYGEETSTINLWFSVPSEGVGVQVAPGASYNDGWFPVDESASQSENYILYSKEKVYTENGDEIGAKRGNSFFALKVTPDADSKRRLYVKLNTRVYKGTEYKVNFDYFIGKINNTSENRLEFDVDVYLVTDKTIVPEEMVDDEEGNGTEGEEGNESEPPEIEESKIQYLGELLDDKTTNKWVNFSLKFISDIDSAEEGYLLFVPKNKTTYSSAYLSLEQGDNESIEKNISIKDLGVKFLGTNYRDTYGIDDKKLVDTEEVEVEIGIKNTSSGVWKEEERFEIDFSGFFNENSQSKISTLDIDSSIYTLDGMLEESDYSKFSYKIENNTKVIIETSSEYEIKSGKEYKLKFNVKYNTRGPGNLNSNVKYRFFNNNTENEGLLEEIKGGQFDFIEEIEMSELNEDGTEVKVGNNKVGYHNVIIVPHTSEGEFDDEQYVVKLGDNITKDTNDPLFGSENDDGWIAETVTKNNSLMSKIKRLFSTETVEGNTREIYLGYNTIKVKASHDGYVGVFARQGYKTSSGTNYSWERLVVGEVKAGTENNISFEVANNVDEISNIILKYSLKKNEAGNLTSNSTSGEIENYSTKTINSFESELISLTDNGYQWEQIIGADDGVLQFKENLTYLIKITNLQNTFSTGKRLIFMSNMSLLQQNMVSTYSDRECKNEITGRVTRIAKRSLENGVYDIYLGSIQPNETFYLKVDASLVNEFIKEYQDDIEGENKWKLISKLYESNNELFNIVDSRPVADRNYGETKKLDIFEETRHYKLEEEGKDFLNKIVLGKNDRGSVNYNNNLGSGINDGIILPRYARQEPEEYRGRYILIAEQENEVLTVASTEDEGYISMWLNIQGDWRPGFEDRVAYFDTKNTNIEHTTNPKTMSRDEALELYKSAPDEDKDKIGEHNYLSTIIPEKVNKVEERIFRARIALDLLDVKLSPTVNAASGEIEDYSILVFPAFAPTLSVTNLGVDLDSTNKEIGKEDKGKAENINFGGKLEYNIHVVNVSNRNSEDREIIYRTNMGTVLEITNSKIYDEFKTDVKDYGATIRERENTSGDGYKEYTIFFPEITGGYEVDVTFEVRVDREDTKNWKMQDIFYNAGEEWEVKEYNYLNRNYGAEELAKDNQEVDARHYQLQYNGDFIKLGEEISIVTENTENFLKLKEGGDGVKFPQMEGVTSENEEIKDVIFSDAATRLEIKPSLDKGYISAWITDADSIDDPNWINLLPIGAEYTSGELKVAVERLEKSEENPGWKYLNVKPGVLEIGKKYIVRIRYAYNEEDIEEPIGYAKTGETEDYLVVAEEAVIWNIEWEDLGLRVKDGTNPVYFGGGDYLTPNIVGNTIRDAVSFREEVKYKINFKNRSKTKVEPPIMSYYTSMGELLDAGSVVTELIPEIEIVNGDSSQTPPTVKISEIGTTNVSTNENNYEIVTDKLEGFQEVNIYFVSKMNRERKTNWNSSEIFREKKNVDPDKKWDYDFILPDRNLGYFYENFQNIDDYARHYKIYPEKNVEPIRLGKNINFTNLRADKNSSDFDGVKFPTRNLNSVPAATNEKNVIFSGVPTPIKVSPTYDGFVTFWEVVTDVNDRVISYKNISLKDINDENKTIGGAIPVVGNQENTIYLLSSSPFNSERNIRVRYSALEEDVLDFMGPASTGEVEDYTNIKVVSAISIENIEMENLGVKVLEGEEEEIWEADTENLKYAPKYKGTLRYTITLKNNTDTSAPLENIFYNTNMGVYNGESGVKRAEEEDKDRILTFETTDTGNNKTYKLSNITLEPNEDNLKIWFEVDLTNENKSNNQTWELIERIIESEVNRYYRKDSMNRVYASEIPNVDSTYHNVNNYQGAVRHYQLSRGTVNDYPMIGSSPSHDNTIKAQWLWNSDEGYYYYNTLGGDGVEFKTVANLSGRNVLPVDSLHQLPITVNNSGYISVWISEGYNKAWRRVNIADENSETTKVTLASNTPTKVNIPIKIVSNEGYDLAGKYFYLRVRYSPRKDDVETALSPAAAGETQDYNVYGVSTLEAIFKEQDNANGEDGTTHEKLGFESGEKIFGRKDSGVYYNENLYYRIIISNTGGDAIENKLIYLWTPLTTYQNEYSVYSGQLNDKVFTRTKKLSDAERNSKVSVGASTGVGNVDNNYYRETVSYPLTINLDPNESIELEIKMKVKKDHVIDYSNKYYFAGIYDKILINNVVVDNKEVSYADSDHENSILVKRDATYSGIYEYEKRARHGIIADEEGKKLQLENNITNDVKNSQYTYSNAADINEDTTDVYPAISNSDLKVELGYVYKDGSTIGGILGKEPNSIANPTATSNGYILYANAKNTIVLNPTHDGYVSIGLQTMGYSFWYGQHNRWENIPTTWGNNLLTLTNQENEETGTVVKVIGGKPNKIVVSLGDYWARNKRWPYSDDNSIKEYDRNTHFRTSYTGALRIRYSLFESDVDTPLGIASVGEVRDYYINNFLTPFIMKFIGDIEDVEDKGITVSTSETGTETKGAGDKVLTLNEEFLTKFSIHNITETEQTGDLEFVVGTAMSKLMEETYTVTSSLNNSKTVIVSKRTGDYSTAYVDPATIYNEAKFDEYIVLVKGGLKAGEKIDLALKSQVKGSADAYNKDMALRQYLLYKNRTIDNRNLYTLTFDNGYDGNYTTYGKHFFFKVDGTSVNLGSGGNFVNTLTPPYSNCDSKLNSGNQGMTELGNRGILDFLKNRKDIYIQGENKIPVGKVNVLYSETSNHFTINASHNGFISLWSNIGENNAWERLDIITEDNKSVKVKYVEARDNAITFKLTDAKTSTMDRKILRVKYGIMKDEIDSDDFTSISSTGEIEDYEYFIMPPLEADFGGWVDLGIVTNFTKAGEYTDTLEREKNLIYGVDDKHWSYKERIRQSITVANITSDDLNETVDQILNRNKLLLISNLKFYIGEDNYVVNGKENFVPSIRLYADDSLVPIEESWKHITITPVNNTKGDYQYEFKFKELDGMTKLKIDFDFYLVETNTSTISNEGFNIEQQLSIRGRIQDFKTNIPAKIDYGKAGWHYYTTEGYHLGTNVNYTDEKNSSKEATLGDNDGLLKINDKSITYSNSGDKTTAVVEVQSRLTTEVENTITLKATADGFVQAWLELPKRNNLGEVTTDKIENYKIFTSDKVVNENLYDGTVYLKANEEKTIRFMLPNEMNANYGMHYPNISNNYPAYKNMHTLKIKYGHTTDEVNTFGSQVGSGEGEDYEVDIARPLEVNFVKYEELGVETFAEGENNTTVIIYGEGDGEVGFGERVRQTIEIINQAPQPLTNDILNNKRIRFVSNNGVLEKTADGSIDLDRLQLSITSDKDGKKPIAKAKITVTEVTEGTYDFKLESESNPDEVFVKNEHWFVHFNYYVADDNKVVAPNEAPNSETRNGVTNKLYYINRYSNDPYTQEIFYRETSGIAQTADPDINVYPFMRKDMETTSDSRHYKVYSDNTKEILPAYLGDKVTYVEGQAGEGLDSENDDGVVIKKISMYQDAPKVTHPSVDNGNPGYLTLFTNEWNDLLIKPTRGGYVRAWLTQYNNHAITDIPLELPIQKWVAPGKETEEFLNHQSTEAIYISKVAEGDKTPNVVVKIPRDIYANVLSNGKYNGRIVIRYSTTKEDLNSFSSLARVGETEEYAVRIVPPIEARYWSPEDYGVKLRSSSSGVGQTVNGEDNIVGYHDEELIIRELFDEVIQFRNLHNRTTSIQTIKITSNIAVPFENYGDPNIKSAQNGTDSNAGLSYVLVKPDSDYKTEPIRYNKSTSYSESEISERIVEIIDYRLNYATTLNLKLEPKEDPIFKLQKRVIKEDTSNWKVNSRLSIGSEVVGMSTTAVPTVIEGYIISDTTNFNQKNNGKEAIYRIFNRDYENASIYNNLANENYYGHHHGSNIRNYPYDNSVSGTRAYMIKPNETTDYVKLGDSIKKESDPDLVEYYPRVGKYYNSDDDGVKINHDSSDSLLYNNVNNKFTVESSHNGYVSIWLWARRYDTCCCWYYYGGCRARVGAPATWNENKGNSDANRNYVSGWKLVTVAKTDELKFLNDDGVIKIEGGENDIRRYIPDLSYRPDALIRVKYSLEKEDMGHASATAYVEMGEIEDYKVIYNEDALEFVKVKIDDLGIADTENNKVYEQTQDGQNENYLSYKEDFNYVLTYRNKVPAENYYIANHYSSYTLGDSVQENISLTGDRVSESGTSIVIEPNISNPEGADVFKIKNMPAAVSRSNPAYITFNFKAKVNKENDERRYPTSDTYYIRTDWWHGNGFFKWFRSPLEPADSYNNNYSNSPKETTIYLANKLEGTTIVNANSEGTYSDDHTYLYELNGPNQPWSQEENNDTVTSTGPAPVSTYQDTTRNYGRGLVGANQNIYTEVRHYMARDSVGRIMKIGDKFTANGMLGGKPKPDDRIAFDGVETINGTTIETNNYILLYSGIDNPLRIKVSHPGYISFFISRDATEGVKYVYTSPETGTWANSQLKIRKYDENPKEDNENPEEVQETEEIAENSNEYIYKVKAGTNEIYLSIPELSEGDKVLRLRYAIDPEEIESPTTPASTGEVQDMVVYVKPLETGFIAKKDLGIYSEYSDTKLNSRVGKEDTKYQLGELYYIDFTTENLDKDEEHKDAPIQIHSNIARLYVASDPKGRFTTTLNSLESQGLIDPEEYNISGEGNCFYEVYTYKNNGNVGEGDPITGDLLSNSLGFEGENPDKILSIKEEKLGSGHRYGEGYLYSISIPKMSNEEIIKIRLWFKIVDEDLNNSYYEDWRSNHKLIINGDIQDTESMTVMARDYGSGYLETDPTKEGRNYILRENYSTSEYISLEQAYDTENQPTQNEVSNDPYLEEGGIDFNEYDDETGKPVIYNNMINKITLRASHQGYTSFWISNGENWVEDYSNDTSTDRIEIKDKINHDGVEHSFESNIGPVKEFSSKEENALRVRFGDLRSLSPEEYENKYLRIRYALDMEDIEKPNSPARSGQTNDYPIEIKRGLSVTFLDSQDLGLNVSVGIDKDGESTKSILIGERDTNLIPGEKYQHRLRIENLTGTDQEEISFVYSTVIGNVLDESDKSLEGTTKELDLVLSKKDEGDPDSEFIELPENEKRPAKIKYDGTKSVTLENGEIEIRHQYKVTIYPVFNNGEMVVPGIGENEVLYTIVTGRVVGEDEINWKMIDSIYIDTEETDKREIPMNRDYGRGLITGNYKLEQLFREEGRNYIVTINGIDVGLIDNKEKNGGSEIEKDEKPSVVSPDYDYSDMSFNDYGVEFDEPDDILYSNLKNRLRLKSVFPAYVTLWMNNSVYEGGFWDTSSINNKDMLKSKKNEELRNYREWNFVEGNYDIFTGERLFTGTKVNRQPLFVVIPNYLGEKKVIRIRYSIAREDIDTDEKGKGILSPLGTAITGEIEDYEVDVISGISAELGGIIDLGINSDEYFSEESNAPIHSNNKESEDKQKESRIGVNDGNASHNEIVTTILKVTNLTPLMQNGFTEPDKNSIIVKINNGYLETTGLDNNNFIWIKSSGGQNIDGTPIETTEFQNRITDWLPPVYGVEDDLELSYPTNPADGGEHRIRVVELSEADLSNKGITPDTDEDNGTEHKYYEIILDKIFAYETLEIHLRQHVIDNFVENDGNVFRIVNELIYQEKNNVDVEDNDDGKVKEVEMPMKRDYGNDGTNLSNKVEARHYSANLPLTTENPEVRVMKLGDNYTTENTPGEEDISSDNGMKFLKDKTEAPIIYSGFWNVVPLDINYEGKITLWSVQDVNNTVPENKWNRLSVELDINNIYDEQGEDKENSQLLYYMKPTSDKNRNLLYFKAPEGEINSELKLRIRYSYNGFDVEVPVGPASSGEVEDYNVIYKEGIKLELLEEFEDLGIPLESSTTLNEDGLLEKEENYIKNRVGYRDGNVSPGEDIIRKVTIENLTPIKQRDIKITYATDIGEVDSTFWEIRKVKSDGTTELINSNYHNGSDPNRKVEVKKVSNSKAVSDSKYQITLNYIEGIDGEIPDNTPIEELRGEKVEILIKQKVKAEGIEDGSPDIDNSEKKLYARENWHLSDYVYYGHGNSQDDVNEKDDSISEDGNNKNVPMKRDYGRNLLNDSIVDSFTGIRHYTVRENLPLYSSADQTLKPYYRLGDNIIEEEGPESSFGTENDGLDFITHIIAPLSTENEEGYI